MVNSNPETVSTDYDTSDKLYFEPLTKEDVLFQEMMTETESQMHLTYAQIRHLRILTLLMQTAVQLQKKIQTKMESQTT